VTLCRLSHFLHPIVNLDLPTRSSSPDPPDLFPLAFGVLYAGGRAYPWRRGSGALPGAHQLRAPGALRSVYPTPPRIAPTWALASGCPPLAPREHAEDHTQQELLTMRALFL
jgi:hypothetical protein